MPMHIGFHYSTIRSLQLQLTIFAKKISLGRVDLGLFYKGCLQRVDQLVAVKKLDSNGFQGEREFLTETLILQRHRHPNIVRLIGYCAEGSHRLLVYEYMPLGCLEDHLLDLLPEDEPLDWNTRMMIAAGIAKAVRFLHDEVDPPIICRDIKSSNILLGDGFYPKLSDFGLAKFGPDKTKTHVSTRVMGTEGYCAPEYAATGKLTEKSDVYCFGIVLLEMITGRRAFDDSRRSEEHYILDWIYSMMRESRNLSRIVDPRLKGEYSMSSLRMALDVALRCLQNDPKVRPGIKDVDESLSLLVSPGYELDHPDEGKEGDRSCMDREQAVAEAKLWGESWRGKKHQDSQDSVGSLDST